MAHKSSIINTSEKLVQLQLQWKILLQLDAWRRPRREGRINDNACVPAARQRQGELGDSRRNTEEERRLTQRTRRAQRLAEREEAAKPSAAGEYLVKLMRELSMDGYSMSIGMYRLVFEYGCSNTRPELARWWGLSFF